MTDPRPSGDDGGDGGDGDDRVAEQFRFMAQAARQRGHSDLYMQRMAKDSRAAAFRQRCMDWVYSMAHAIHLDKHGAWCAIAILDKYLSADVTPAGSETEFRMNTKLKCLCAMMISSKVNGCGHKVTPQIAAHLSAGLFSVKQVLQHERDVMGALSWNVNFVSPYEAIHLLVPHIVQSADVAAVAEVSAKMIDSARAAPSMIGVSAAVSACAAVHIALQHCEASRRQRYQLHLAAVASSASISADDMEKCAAQLCCVFVVGAAAARNQQSTAAKAPAAGAAAPSAGTVAPAPVPVPVPVQCRQSPTGVDNLDVHRCSVSSSEPGRGQKRMQDSDSTPNCMGGDSVHIPPPKRTATGRWAAIH
jgi:hypothetical protein